MEKFRKLRQGWKVLQRVSKDGRKVAFDDFFERVPALGQTVVGEAVLGEVVGLDLFGTHTTADGAPTTTDLNLVFLFGFFP